MTSRPARSAAGLQHSAGYRCFGPCLLCRKSIGTRSTDISEALKNSLRAIPILHRTCGQPVAEEGGWAEGGIQLSDVGTARRAKKLGPVAGDRGSEREAS